MRESVRTRDLSWSCRHSSMIMHLLECVFSLEPVADPETPRGGGGGGGGEFVNKLLFFFCKYNNI